MTNTIMKKHTDEEKNKTTIVLLLFQVKRGELPPKGIASRLLTCLLSFRPSRHTSATAPTAHSRGRRLRASAIYINILKTRFNATPAQITCSAAVTAGASANLREANQDLKSSS
jgi:hypothetical protein